MPYTLLLRPAFILGILLAISVAANAALWEAWTGRLQELGAERARTVAAARDAKACSDGVERLRAAAEERARAVAAAIAAAQARAAETERRALATLQEQPAIPADACGSALELSRQKMQERRAP